MTDAVLIELQRITRLAACRADHDNVKSAIASAARRLGLSYRRARSFWYAADGTAVRAAEADRLRAEKPALVRERQFHLMREAAQLDHC